MDPILQSWRDVIAALGGYTLILGALFGWIGKRYLDQRLEAEKSQYATELEVRKDSLEKHSHVYKSQFELEFKTYQEIWAACATLMDRVARLASLYKWTELPNGKGEKRRLGKLADEAFFDANLRIHKNRPFIPAEICDSAIRYTVACKEQINEFFGAIHAEERNDPDYDQDAARAEAKNELQDVKRQFEELADGIRHRLSSLLVVDE